MTHMTVASRAIAFLHTAQDCETRTPEDTLAARLAWVEKMQLKQKCGVALATKRLFDEDQKEFIEGYLAMYGDLG